MSSAPISGWAWAAASVAANVSASILLKMSSRLPLQDLVSLRDYRGPALMIGALTCYGLAFISYFLTLRQLPVSLAYVAITAGAAVSLALAGVFVFREPVHGRQIIGFAFALVGLIFIVSASAGPNATRPPIVKTPS